MGTIDVHARKDLRAIYRELEGSFETREKLVKLVETGTVRIEFNKPIERILDVPGRD